jgi:hypothetical protein
MVVRFNTVRQDFPPNIDDRRLKQALLYVVCTAGQAFEVSDTQLLLITSGETTPVGGTSGSSIEGIISTRRSNAGEWTALIGRSPIGEWKLTLPNTQEVKNRFKNEEIEDVLLVVTTPPHPSMAGVGRVFFRPPPPQAPALPPQPRLEVAPGYASRRGNTSVSWFP